MVAWRPRCAIQSTLEKGVGQTTVEFKISLVRPVTPETGLIKAPSLQFPDVRQLIATPVATQPIGTGWYGLARRPALPSEKIRENGLRDTQVHGVG
jgi:hypothetical protein